MEALLWRRLFLVKGVSLCVGCRFEEGFSLTGVSRVLKLLVEGRGSSSGVRFWFQAGLSLKGASP